MTNLLLEFKATLDSQNAGKGITQKDWAEKVSIDPSIITKFIQGRRAGDTLLKKICHQDNWDNACSGTMMALAHLKDEAERCNIPEGVVITFS